MLVSFPSSIRPKLCQIALGILLPFTSAGAAEVKDHLPGDASGVTVIKCGAVIDGLAPRPPDQTTHYDLERAHHIHRAR